MERGVLPIGDWSISITLSNCSRPSISSWAPGIHPVSYTHLVLDSNGNEIVLPDGVTASSIEVSNDGKFYYKDAAGNTIDMNRQIGVYQFTNPAGLEKDSGSLLVATAASGNPMNELTTPCLLYTSVCKGIL